MKGADVLKTTWIVLMVCTYTFTFALPATVESTVIPVTEGADVKGSVKLYVARSVSTQDIDPTSRTTSSPSGEEAVYTYLGGLL